MARSRRRKARQKPRSVRYGRKYVEYREGVKKASEKKYKRRIQRPIENKGTLREKYPIQEDRDQSRTL